MSRRKNIRERRLKCMINDDPIGQVPSDADIKFYMSRDTVSQYMTYTTRLITIHWLIIHSVYLILRRRVYAREEPPVRIAVGNRQSKKATLMEHLSVVSTCLLRGTSYRSNVSLHLTSDYYLVNIDSQLAPALMRQRIASSLHMPKTMSIVIGAQPRDFMQTLYIQPLWLFTVLSL